MDIETIGIHDSVRPVFPPEVLAGALSDIEPDVAVIGTEEIPEVEAIVTLAYKESFLEHLQWVHTIQAGYDRFPLDAIDRAGVRLTNSEGIHGESVGETAVGLMLSLARRLHHYVENQEARSWDRPDWDEAFTLFGESACVVGLGTLGQGVARRAAGMDMEVIGVRRTPTRVPHVSDVFTPSALHDAIGDARFVVLTLPLTEETQGMFGPSEFETMREDAYFLNVGRGQVVQEDALIGAIQSGEIAGAGLDVFEVEPLPSESPLWDMDEVIVTPHVAAMTNDYYRDVAPLVRENVALLAAGEEPVNRVV